MVVVVTVGGGEGVVVGLVVVVVVGPGRVVVGPGGVVVVARMVVVVVGKVVVVVVELVVGVDVVGVDVVGGAVVVVDVSGTLETWNDAPPQPETFPQALTVWEPAAASPGMVMPVLKFPSTSGLVVPRLEHPVASQHRLTVASRRKPVPLTVAEEPGGPEDGEIEIDAAAAGCADVTWSIRSIDTRASTSVPAVTRRK
ncbi:MAG: hypothetical protein ACRDZM_12055 [Acidimicrobiia bacterium]